MSDLRWTWLAVLLGLVVLGLLVRWSLRPRHTASGPLVAHTERFRSLPRYRALAWRELLVAGVATLGALVLVTGSILLGARPTEPVIVQPDRNGRDIMLCLDVSASMDPWNRQVVDSFRQLLDGLNGERIGLTIFSGLAVTVFPLTDDYQYVDTKLDEAEAAFTGDSFDYFVGAEALALRASQSGDGLMSCLQRMTVNRDKRARAVVLATDNDPVGRGIFVLPEAAESAARGGVVVYGIGTPDMKPKQSEEFAAAAASTGGAMTVVQDGEGVDDLVRAIQKLERDRLRPVPTGVVVDDPATPFAIAVAGMVVLLGGALVGRRRR